MSDRRESGGDRRSEAEEPGSLTGSGSRQENKSDQIDLSQPGGETVDKIETQGHADGGPTD